MPKPEITIIGAGPNGLATGIRLLMAGHKVRILESSPLLGQGISQRPPFNPNGIMHSGIYYPEGSITSRACYSTFRWFALRPEADPIYRIYRDNSFQNGKLILANSDEGMAVLSQLQARAEKNGIRNIIHTDTAGISSFREPIGDARAVLELPDVRAIRIVPYLSGLKSFFLEHGGTIEYNKRVEGLEFLKFPDRVRLNFADGTETTASHVINHAGLDGPRIAQLSEQAAKSESRIPEPEYYAYGVLVRKDDRGPGPDPRHVIYSAENASLPSVGPHTYLSRETGSDRWAATIGPLAYKTDYETINRGDWRDVIPKQISESVATQAKRVLAGIDMSDYELKPVGTIVRIGQERDFYIKPAADIFVNALASDSPGLTCTPVISDYVARMITRNPTIAAPTNIR